MTWWMWLTLVWVVFVLLVWIAVELDMWRWRRGIKQTTPAYRTAIEEGRRRRRRRIRGLW